jgi:DNA repair exonuclease SbcCD ATPase subunit
MTADALSAPGAELQAFGQAGEQALRLIEQATASGDGGTVSAIEAVILLDDAMQRLRPLRSAVPALLAAARPGPAVESGLSAETEELSGLEERVSAARRDWELAAAREQAARDRLAELAALKAQVDELRRLERLVAVLDDLNGQRQVIEERLVTLRELTTDPEQAIAAAAGELVTLAEERRALLAPRARDGLAKAREALQALAAEERSEREDRERFETARQRHTQLIAERDERLAQLQSYARADSAVAAALSAAGGPASALERLRSTLDGIATQLTDVEHTLRDTLAGHQAAYDREHDALA